MRAPQAFALSLSLCALAMTAAARADAQETLDPVALDLFQQGRRLIKDGDWDGGCAAIDASLKRAQSVSALLNLALCQEHRGKVASAWATVDRARTANRETKGAERRDELARSADEISERLRPRLSRLRVLAPTVEGARVTEGGRELPLDTPVLLDPGSYELVMTAPGHAEVRRTVELREGEVLATELTLASPARSDPEPGHAPPRPPGVEPAPAALEEPSSDLPVWAFIAAGAGVAMGAVAIGFGVDAANTAAALEERCGEDLVCDEDLSFDPTEDNARKNRHLGLAVGFGVGGAAALAAGLIGIGLAAASPSAPQVTIWTDPSGGSGLLLRGRF